MNKVTYMRLAWRCKGLPWWLSGKEAPCQMQETQVWPLGWEDPLEKEMATHSSILAWEIPWTEDSDGLQSMGSQRVGHDLVTKQLQDRDEKLVWMMYTESALLLQSSRKFTHICGLQVEMCRTDALSPLPGQATSPLGSSSSAAAAGSLPFCFPLSKSKSVH